MGVLVALTALVSLLVAVIAPGVGSAQAAGSGELRVDVDLDGGVIEITEVLRPADGETLVAQIPPTASDVVTANARIVADETVEGVSRNLTLDVDSGEATLSYRMADGAEVPGGQDVQVGEGIVAFNLWPNMRTTTVVVTLPEGFTADIGDDFVSEEIDDDTFRYTLEDGDVERIWGLRVLASQEAGLNRRTVEVGEGAMIEIAGFADDAEWLDYAEEYVTDGIPLLAGLVGQPWPASELELLASSTPGELGYGGWYDLRKARIEISNDQDPELLFHELSHAWFNDLLFEHRWLIEGFAEAYAQEAVEQYGDEVVGITSPGSAPDRFEGLNRWRTRFFFEDNFDEEIYGYRASGFVIAELLDEIGTESMAVVLDEMIDGNHPYTVDGDRRAIGTNDWRRFLDMVEIRGGSNQAESLFRQYVATEGQQDLLDERDDAIEAYGAFEDQVAGGVRGQVPEGIRYAMSDWEFDDALRGIERATEADARMTQLEKRAQALDLALPPFLDDVYLASDTGFRRVEAALDDAEAALAGLEERGDAVTEEETRNFVLGRFDQMDLSGALPDGPRLNQDRGESTVPWRLYGIIAGGLILALLILAIIAARLPPPKPKMAEGDGGNNRGPVGQDPDDIPIYRPQAPVLERTPALSSSVPTASAPGLANYPPPPLPPPPPPPVSPTRDSLPGGESVDLGDLPPPSSGGPL